MLSRETLLHTPSRGQLLREAKSLMVPRARSVVDRQLHMHGLESQQRVHGPMSCPRVGSAELSLSLRA